MNLKNEDLPLSAKLMEMIQGHQMTQAIYVIATLGIADLLSTGPKSSDELAQLTQVNASALYRVLRFLGAAGVLVETESRTFALTPLGNYLRSDVPDSLHFYALYQGGETMWPLLGHLLYSVQTGNPAIKKALGTDVGQFFRQTSIFDRHLATHAIQLASVAASVYDFSGVKTLVDVGGRQGQMLTTLLKAYPLLSGVLFDLPQVIEDARQFIGSTEVTDRCELVSGDFLVSVPPGHDGYLLSRVIHDWSDEQAMTILQNCHHAMREDGRLLLLESVILTTQELDMRALRSDLAMLLISSGGQERTEGEYRVLLEAAGFEFLQTVPLQPPYCLIEARPCP